MKIIKINEIDSVYSEMLMGLLSKGLKIYSNGCSGTQGERVKVRLTDGKDVYSLSMYDERNKDLDNLYISKIIIKLEVFRNKYKNHLAYQTLWNGEGEEIYTKEFYKLELKEVYVETIEEWKEWYNIHNSRVERKYSTIVQKELNLDRDRILNIIKSKKGYKRTKKKDIIGVYRRGKIYTIKIMKNNEIKPIYKTLPF